MKRIRIVGLCIIAAFAMSAVLSATAFAQGEVGHCKAQAGGKYENSTCTEPAVAGKEKYEWTPLAGSISFTSKMPSADKATLESEKKTKVVCTGESTTGKLSATGVSHVVATFTGCEFSSVKCNTAGQSAGTIVTEEMDGGFGVEKIGTKGDENAKLAEELKPESAPLFVTFECVGTVIEVKNSILHPVSDDKSLSKETEKFTESKGKNKPDKYEGGPEQDLEAKFGATGKFEHSGQTVTTETTFSEAIELDSEV